MPELMNNISKMSIRGEANLIFAMMKFMVTVLDMAIDNPIVRETLICMVESISEQANTLMHDVEEYVTTLSCSEGRVSIVEERNKKIET